MVRTPGCENRGLKKGPWTPEEDQVLVSFILKYGHVNWRALPKRAGLLRCGTSCRLRWIKYLRPDIKRGNFSKEEEEIIIKLHQFIGNRWSIIAARLPGRTDNDVKNHWNTKLKKKLSGMGIDPVTHKPFPHVMAEIATTLEPPQVAHLAEGALDYFKDVMPPSHLVPTAGNSTATSFMPLVRQDSSEEIQFHLCNDAVKSTGDMVLEGESNNIPPFQALQLFNTVEQRRGSDSLFQKENPIEAPESSDQTEKCPDPTPSIEPVKPCDANNEDSFSRWIERESGVEEHDSLFRKPPLIPPSGWKGKGKVVETSDGKLSPQSSEQNEKYSDLIRGIGLRVPVCDANDQFILSRLLEDSVFQGGKLLPESSDQNEKRSDPTSSIERTEACNAFGEGSLAVIETSEERNANTSLNLAAKSAEGKSTGSVGSKRDWAWKYCSSIPGNNNGVICSFCDLEIKGGGITRFKSHIFGSDPSKNVKKCGKVPLEAKVEIDHKKIKRR